MQISTGYSLSNLKNSLEESILSILGVLKKLYSDIVDSLSILEIPKRL